MKKKMLLLPLPELKMHRPLNWRLPLPQKMLRGMGWMLTALSGAALTAKKILSSLKNFAESLPEWIREPLLRILKMALEPSDLSSPTQTPDVCSGS